MNIKRILAGYTLAHFLVDMGCAMLIYHIIAYYDAGVKSPFALFMMLTHGVFASLRSVLSKQPLAV